MKRLWLLVPLLGLLLLPETLPRTYSTSFAMPVNVPLTVELGPIHSPQGCCRLTLTNPSHQYLDAECSVTAYRPNGTVGFQGRIVGGTAGLIAPPGHTTGYSGVFGTNNRSQRRPYKWRPRWRIITRCSAFKWIGGPVL